MARIEYIEKSDKDESPVNELPIKVNKEKWLKWFVGYNAAVRKGEHPEYRPRESFAV